MIDAIAKLKPANFAYDPEVDALYIKIRDAAVAYTKQLAIDVIIDYDRDRQVVGIEILDAKKRLIDLTRKGTSDKSRVSS